MNKVGIDCTPKDIEVVHRLPGRNIPQTTIIRRRRDFLEDIQANRKSLSKGGLEIGFPTGTAIYINCNLCPYLKGLAYHCRKIKRARLIEDTWVFNGKLKIKKLDGEICTIDHEFVLFNLFPDFNEYTFDTSFYKYILSDERDINSYDDCDGV